MLGNSKVAKYDLLLFLHNETILRVVLDILIIICLDKKRIVL